MLALVLKTLFELYHMVVQLHDSGADKTIIDSIHKIVNTAHGEVKKHHEEHVE